MVAALKIKSPIVIDTASRRARRAKDQLLASILATAGKGECC